MYLDTRKSIELHQIENGFLVEAYLPSTHQNAYWFSTNFNDAVAIFQDVFNNEELWKEKEKEKNSE